MERALRVAVVDDDPGILTLMSVVVELAPDMELVGKAATGACAISMAAQQRPDVIVMDVTMPGLSGAEATEQILHLNPCVRVLAHTGHVEAAHITEMLVAGATGYAVKGTHPDSLLDAIRHVARGGTHIDGAALPGIVSSVTQLARAERERRRETERLHEELKTTFDESIRALAFALESRDHYTGDHDDRVAANAVRVGRELGLDEHALTDIEYGAIFHDVGKIAIPDSILLGTRKGLTASEWAVIRTHTLVGERIISPIKFLRNAARIVRNSHEHWDGSGYPDGLQMQQIPIGSRVVLACDAWDAMTGGRTYQDPVSTVAATDELHELSGTHFDPDVVEALCAVVA